jgi:predicted nucleic acid-binding protein
MVTLTSERYLVDSDIVSFHLAQRRDAVELLRQLAPFGIAISAITYLELYQSALQNPHPEEAHARLAEFVAAIPIIDVTAQVARRCAILRFTLASEGRRVRDRAFDLVIAATALEHDLTLITYNKADYRDIEGLKLA